MSTTKTLEKAELYRKTTTKRIITRALLAAGATVLVAGFAFGGSYAQAKKSPAAKEKPAAVVASEDTMLWVLDELNSIGKDSCFVCPSAIAKPDSRGARIKASIEGRICNNADTIVERLGNGKPVDVRVEITVDRQGYVTGQKMIAFCEGVKCRDGEIEKIVVFNFVGRQVDAPMSGCCTLMFIVPVEAESTQLKRNWDAF
jgi:hypothetical protein